jgi:hypothetical protein
MNITEGSLKRNKYNRLVQESKSHVDYYVCTWTKVIEDKNGRKFNINIIEYDTGVLLQYGFPKYTIEGSFFRYDYKEHFTVTYFGPENATVKSIENFYNEIWLKMSCQYDFED